MPAIEFVTVTYSIIKYNLIKEHYLILLLKKNIFLDKYFCAHFRSN